MKGRFIIDTYRKAHTIYVYLREFSSEDVYDTFTFDLEEEIVAVDVDKDGNALGVEIILPQEGWHE